jgi:hypothetical protein
MCKVEDWWNPVGTVPDLLKTLYDTMPAWHRNEALKESVSMQLHFLCLGANMSELPAISHIRERIKLRRENLNIANLCSPEEKTFMQNVALILTRKTKKINPWKLFSIVRSFITYNNGLFMAPGFESVSRESVWPTTPGRGANFCFCVHCIGDMREYADKLIACKT